MKSDVYTLASLLFALTAQQEEIEFYLRCGAAFVAIVAGLLAIVQRLRRNGKKE